jgi:hypothetical protein
LFKKRLEARLIQEEAALSIKKCSIASRVLALHSRVCAIWNERKADLDGFFVAFCGI